MAKKRCVLRPASNAGSRDFALSISALSAARAASEAGVKIYEGTRGHPRADGQSGEVKTENGCVKARHIVIGCNAYLGSLVPRMAGNIMPINNFVIATERLPSHLLPRINRDNLSMSDTLFVINYWKLPVVDHEQRVGHRQVVPVNPRQEMRRQTLSGDHEIIDRHDIARHARH